MSQQIPVDLRWKGEFYRVTCSFGQGKADASVVPDNLSLKDAVVASLKGDPGKPLKVRHAFEGYWYLADDPDCGKAAMNEETSKEADRLKSSIDNLRAEWDRLDGGFNDTKQQSVSTRIEILKKKLKELNDEEY